MNSTSKRALKCGVLLQTASFLALASVSAAQAQMAAANNQVDEQVLVTGSLIHGAEAVGYPLVGLSDQDFMESGGVILSDVLKDVPSVSVQTSNPINESGGQALHNENVAIHGVQSATASETLLLIDGIRFPPQGVGFCVVDPSIVPSLAVDHVDVLADGASAVYGSDAVAGVINVNLKRGFDGAITQAQITASTDLGGATFEGQQLFGRTWSGGDITLSYEWLHTNPVSGPGRPYFTENFLPYGYINETALMNSMPGIVSAGTPAITSGEKSAGFKVTNGTLCTNCFSIPSGTGFNYGTQAANPLGFTSTPIPTISWAALTASANQGVFNEVNPAAMASILPSEDTNAATFTFDQDIINNVQFFAEGFYSHRQSYELYTPGASPAQQQDLSEFPVPTSNPYFPTGAPSNILVNYTLGFEQNSTINSIETAFHLEGGFNVQLPYDWHAKVYYAYSEDIANELVNGMANTNMISAALGWTVAGGTAATSGFQFGINTGSFTKPSTVPYLNVFCDATKFTCNSQTTLNFISAYRYYNNYWNIGESGLNLDGPVFDLPAGPVRVAVGFNTFSDHNDHQEHSDFSTFSTADPLVLLDPSGYFSWDSYIQADIPFVSDKNKFLFVQAFDIQASGRYDHYNTFGPVWTPKVSADWVVGWGFKAFGGYGTSFRAPIPAETSEVNGGQVQGYNPAAGQAAGVLQLNCNNGTTAAAGSLDAVLNPTCAAATEAPGGIQLAGGAGVAFPVRNGTGINPETSQNWNMGLEFKPTDFLAGLDVQATWWHLRINNAINANGSGLPTNVAIDDNPAYKVCTAPGTGCYFFVPANPSKPITDPSNAVFYNMVLNSIQEPRNVVPGADITNIEFIADTASANTGFLEYGGIDFNARYDFDLGQLGAWNVGVTGTYELTDKVRPLPGLPTVNQYTDAPCATGEGTSCADSGGRLPYRARVGWAGTNDLEGWSITAFVNHLPHSENMATPTPPACFWAPGFSTGSCYPAGGAGPGSPPSPYAANYAMVNGAPVFKNFMPGLYTFDLSIGYQTGTKPANPYLQNLNIQLTVNDLLDKAPPFEFSFASNRSVAAFVSAPFPVGGGSGGGGSIGPMQRTITFALTKAW